MDKIVVALYDSFENAYAAVEDLRDRGFRKEDVSLIANDVQGDYAPYVGMDESVPEYGAEEGAAAAGGAAAGAVIGGLTGLLVGLGALAIPGIGPAIAAGPLVATLAGKGIGAATGGLLGALVEAGVPEEAAGYFSEGVRRGGTLVSVTTTGDMSAEAMRILNSHHPVDVNRRVADWLSNDWERYDVQGDPYTPEQIALERQRYRRAAARDTVVEDRPVTGVEIYNSIHDEDRDTR